MLEELLKLTGPITVDGLRFTGDNVQRTLEYEVEYGFVDRGRSREERKNILKDFEMHFWALFQKMRCFNLRHTLKLFVHSLQKNTLWPGLQMQPCSRKSTARAQMGDLYVQRVIALLG